MTLKFARKWIFPDMPQKTVYLLHNLTIHLYCTKSFTAFFLYIVTTKALLISMSTDWKQKLVPSNPGVNVQNVNSTLCVRLPEAAQHFMFHCSHAQSGGTLLVFTESVLEN